VNDMVRKNSADLLTYSRFILATVAAFSLWKSPSEFVTPLLFTAGVYLTDFFDGRVARMYSVETLRGALLDALADFYYIILMHILLARQGILPGWYPMIIVWKFAEFMGTSFYLSKSKGRFRAVHDPVGRLLAIWFYATPAAIIIIQYYEVSVLLAQAANMAYLVTACVLLSSFCRIVTACRY
jgi:phosphatidylglycerophosphate synthase